MHARSINCMRFMNTGWCTVLCLEDNKHYVSLASKLESEDGLGLSPGDIKCGKTVIWHYRGAPYEATILEVHSMLIQ